MFCMIINLVSYCEGRIEVENKTKYSLDTKDGVTGECKKYIYPCNRQWRPIGL
jgi:hypothetical protein